MNKVRSGEERGSTSRTSRIMIRSTRLENEVERLLPGLPDDIILDQIVPKLPWGELHNLSSVNRHWRETKQRRELYDARVRSHSTDTLVVINNSVVENVVLLYSVRDNSSYELPQFPKSQNSQRAVSSSYECISLDGKIFILGGMKEDPYATCSLNEDSDDDCYGLEPCNEVYVLDLAGRMEWKQCADMPEPRYSFGCGVIDGKIYVCGGRTSGGKDILRSWVYDPNENSWSSIMRMQVIRTHPQVVAMGKRLFVHGGGRNAQGLSGTYHYGGDTEVYHPGKNKWTLLNWHQYKGRLLVAQGKLHMITPIAIYEHSIDSDGSFSWTLLHTFGKVLFADRHGRGYDVCATQFVNGELLALTWADATYQVGGYVKARTGQTILHRSIGFGSVKQKISWEKVPCGILENRWFHKFLCTVEL